MLQNAEVIELHGFSDASEKAYRAAFYARSVTAAGKVKVKLVTSKTCVSPIKRVTIPRLQLNSAVLLTKSMHKVQTAVKMDVTTVFYWTDLTIVLSWMNKVQDWYKFHFSTIICIGMSRSVSPLPLFF